MKSDSDLEADFDAYSAWHQRSWHMFLDSEFGSPTGTMAWHEHGGVQAIEISYCALDLSIFACGEMEAAYYGVEKCTSTSKGNGVLCSVHYAGVAASSEDD